MSPEGDRVYSSCSSLNGTSSHHYAARYFSSYPDKIMLGAVRATTQWKWLCRRPGLLEVIEEISLSPRGWQGWNLQPWILYGGREIRPRLIQHCPLKGNKHASVYMESLMLTWKVGVGSLKRLPPPPIAIKVELCWVQGVTLAKLT